MSVFPYKQFVIAANRMGVILGQKLIFAYLKENVLMIQMFSTEFKNLFSLPIYSTLNFENSKQFSKFHTC